MKNIKQKYVEPKLDIATFSREDILTTSGEPFEGDEDPLVVSAQ